MDNYMTEIEHWIKYIGKTVWTITHIEVNCGGTGNYVYPVIIESIIIEKCRQFKIVCKYYSLEHKRHKELTLSKDILFIEKKLAIEYYNNSVQITENDVLDGVLK